MFNLILAAMLAIMPHVEVFHYPQQEAPPQGAIVVDLNLAKGNETTWKFRNLSEAGVVILWGTADRDCAEPKPGCIFVQKFVFKALKKGKTKGMFELVRGTHIYQRVYVDMEVK